MSSSRVAVEDLDAGMHADPDAVNVLFVCLGNICRSPMAEGAFRRTVQQLGFKNKFRRIDSCGTASYHSGERPDPRTIQLLAKHGIHTSHLARQLATSDFNDFDYILAMDDANLRDITSAQPKGSKAKVMLFGNFGDNKREQVQDPYYGGQAGFDKNYLQIVRFTKGFLREVFGAEADE
ncbi:phosphotyrosine protein phosphatase I superfamily [Tuber borchii]|uniref:Phosphotyrosine protein phosphatase I superfamily n=1 Tax=Tuber borchii TaxID=42251 RepID=A0A2T6ZHP0_TUBBO|nr:phosphotyrosine protein phosphatase I superfamily [Tuber borchii]